MGPGTSGAWPRWYPGRSYPLAFMSRCEVNDDEPARTSGLARMRVRGFRTALDVTLRPGRVCALVGEANAGKSNLLAAMWMLLDPLAPAPQRTDVAVGSRRGITIEGDLTSGGSVRLDAAPPKVVRSAPASRQDVLFMPAELRSGAVVAATAAAGGGAGRAHAAIAGTLEQALGQLSGHASSATGAVSLVSALELLRAETVAGIVVLIEEPELFLRPQAQRYLYRLLRELATAGNQVVYSTHAPAFLNVGRLEELVFVHRDPEHGVRVHQPGPFPAASDFRTLSEFDAERSELFLARAVLLVEGVTEKLAFPFVFRALGHDPDREAISIVECGGKANIPLFVQICRAAGVPCVAVHDRDAPPGRRPIAAERFINRQIEEAATADRTVVMAPDFESVAGLRGRRHKPERAWQRFTEAEEPVPEPLARAARLVLALARD